MGNNKYKILIVEDEANIRSFIKANLETSDYQVLCAETCALGIMMYASHRPDLIVLDPPRDGIHPKAIGKILNFGVSHMVYVSCKPTSLARDLEPIQAAGYQVDKLCCVDMFPHTANCETVVSLTRKK